MSRLLKRRTSRDVSGNPRVPEKFVLSDNVTTNEASVPLSSKIFSKFSRPLTGSRPPPRPVLDPVLHCFSGQGNRAVSLHSGSGSLHHVY